MYNDTENQHDAIISNVHLFEDKQIRQNFIKKVYSLLTLNLLITMCIVALFTLHQPLHELAKHSRWLYITFFSISFIILIVISSVGELRRRHPHNIIVLLSFTTAESLMLAAVTVMFETNVILTAGAMTLIICLGLTLFAFQTRIDFTVFNGAVFILFTVALMALLISLFLPKSQLSILIISSIMAIIFGCFLVIDTQMVIGGTHSVQLSPEEYVYAVLTLYLDIVNMFLYILYILASDR